MNRFEVRILVEMFNIRKSRKYPKHIIKDVYTVIDNIFRFGNFCEIGKAYSDFKTKLKDHYITRTPLEYRYVLELIDYLDSFHPHSFVKYADW